jgi:hypothetical protein
MLCCAVPSGEYFAVCDAGCGAYLGKGISADQCENLGAAAAGRYLSVAVEARDDLASPGFKVAVAGAASIEIDADQNHAVPEFTEHNPGPATEPVDDVAGASLGIAAHEPGLRVVGFSFSLWVAVGNLGQRVATLFVSPGHPAALSR